MRTIDDRIIDLIRRYPSIAYCQIKSVMKDVNPDTISAQLNQLSKKRKIRRIMGIEVYSYFPVLKDN